MKKFFQKSLGIAGTTAYVGGQVALGVSVASLGLTAALAYVAGRLLVPPAIIAALFCYPVKLAVDAANLGQIGCVQSFSTLFLLFTIITGIKIFVKKGT